MSLKRENLQSLAKLAHLTIPKRDEKRILSDLSTIVSFFNSLQDIDTDNVKPLYAPLEEAGVFAGDLPDPYRSSDIFLDNAPQSSSSLYSFPPVIHTSRKEE